MLQGTSAPALPPARPPATSPPPHAQALQLHLSSGRTSALDAVLRRIIATLLGPAVSGSGLPPNVLCAAAVADGLPSLVGNTPLLRIRSLSEATGCEILAKAEFLNPGGRWTLMCSWMPLPVKN